MVYLAELLELFKPQNFKSVAFPTGMPLSSFIQMTKSWMQIKSIISCLLSFLIQTLILFSLKLSQIACFIVPVELSSLRLPAWSIESVASIIPRSLMKTPYMEKMVILSMPGQTMDVQCGKIIMTTITDMSFHTMVLLLSSKFYLFIF